MAQVSTISFFKYEGFGNKTWAFGMMQFAHKHLSKANGLSFYKLMGSGKGLGFNPLPDWSTYSLICIWESEAVASTFINDSILFKAYRNKTSSTFTAFMYNKLARGEWSGKQPFKSVPYAENDYVAVITRATIKTRKLYRFWKYVPTSQKPIKTAGGLLYTKGIGEVPLLQMATFSIWENEDHLNAFAYGSREHAKAIKLTKEVDWYKEELFARFKIFKLEGSWPGLHLNL